MANLSLRVSFQDSTYAEYAGDYSPLVTLKEGDNQYTYEFTVNKEVGSDLTFKIQMGYDKDSSTYWAGENQIIIHRVVLTKKAEEE